MRKTKRTIHVIAKLFYPVTSGMETNMVETYSNFVKKGWRVIVHTTRNTHLEKNILKRHEQIKGITVLRYNFNKFNYFPWKMDINFHSRDFICLHGADIFPHYFIYLKTLLFRFLGKKKFILILTPHGLFNLDESGIRSLKIRLKTFFDYTLGVFLINRTVDGVRAVSEWEKTILAKDGIENSRIYVIRNGLEKEALLNVDKLVSNRMKNKVRSLGDYIIQVARIETIKNQATAIKAIKFLPSNIKLVLLGSDHNLEYKKYLYQMIDKYELKNRVIFLGIVRGIDKYYILKNAKMMIHMSRLEGFCNAVHEAKSQGLVCIVSNSSALPELISNGINGYVLDADDYKGVAKKAEYILHNQQNKTIQKMKAENYQSTLNNSWTNVAYKVEQFYLRLMKKEMIINDKYLKNVLIKL